MSEKHQTNEQRLNTGASPDFPQAHACAGKCLHTQLPQIHPGVAADSLSEDSPSPREGPERVGTKVSEERPQGRRRKGLPLSYSPRIPARISRRPCCLRPLSWQGQQHAGAAQQRGAGRRTW